MALILITINDSETGPVVSMIGEPPLTQDIKDPMTPAQLVALNMLSALGQDSKITEKGEIIVEASEVNLQS